MQRKIYIKDLPYTINNEYPSNINIEEGMQNKSKYNIKRNNNINNYKAVLKNNTAFFNGKVGYRQYQQREYSEEELNKLYANLTSTPLV